MVPIVVEPSESSQEVSSQPWRTAYSRLRLMPDPFIILYIAAELLLTQTYPYFVSTPLLCCTF